jgi:hypothetical protein
MYITSRKHLPYAILALLSFPLFLLNIHDVHPWGDDFAQYIKEAQNLACGHAFYKSGYIFNPYNTNYAPPYYPPGFPLLLAPIIKIWGLAIKPMLYFMTVIYVLLLFSLFEYFKKYTGIVVAACLSIAIVYTNYMIFMKEDILSDVPCLLFVVLYFNVRNARSFSVFRILLLIILAVAVVLIRSQLLLLLIAEAIFLLLLIVKQNLRNNQLSVKSVYKSPSVYVITGGLLIIVIINSTLFNAPVSSGSFYYQFVQQTAKGNLVDIVDLNIGRLLPTIGSFLFFESNDYGILNVMISFIHSIGVVFCFSGFLICIRQRLAIEDVFFVLMCLLVIFSPVYDPRYFLPALPLVFFYCFTTIKVILPAIIGRNYSIAAIVMTLLYLRLGYEHLLRYAKETPTNYIPRANEQLLFDFISHSVNDSDVIVFSKPRVLTLYTGKKCVNVAWQITPEMNRRLFDSLHVKYVLVSEELGDDFSKQYLRTVQHPVDSNKIDDLYILYMIR